MATPQEKLANSLEKLQRLQDEGRTAIRARDLTRVHRERLVGSGFLREVMKGWYFPVHPSDRPGDSTAWYSSFWDFCADYCNDRFGDQWCLSPEQSISLHVGNRRIMPQVQVRCAKGGNKPIDLQHQTSIFPMQLKMPSPKDIVKIDGLNLYKLPAAIIEVAPTFFTRNSTDARAALAAFQDSAQLLRTLLEGGHSTKAGRLCGAFRNVGRDEIANDIRKTMEATGYDIREEDPFDEKLTQIMPAATVSPQAGRMRLMWEQMRHSVVEHFTTPESKAIDTTAYMAKVDDAYTTDAYHSLSIEGYRVSLELIEQIRRGKWNPGNNENDRRHHDALAASGYYRAFQAVRQSVQKVLSGQNAGIVARQEHGDWYREMFAPLVTAGMLESASLAGYRDARVFLRGSRHMPASHEAVSELMSVYFDLLENEDSPAVRIVMGHFAFVYVHPYMDGNGRISRFLMNVMLASGGYPWTVIPFESRDDYMASLETASVDQNIVPFTRFIANLVTREMEGNAAAKLPDSKG